MLTSTIISANIFDTSNRTRSAVITGDGGITSDRSCSLISEENTSSYRNSAISGEFTWGSAVPDNNPLIITIDGVDRSVCFLYASIRIDNISSDSPSILTADFFDKDSIGNPNLDEEIVITKSGVRLFAGRLLEVSYKRLGASENILNIVCTDYTRDLNRNLVKENYQDMTDREIIQDIVLRYCSGTGILADEFVSENITVGNITFNYMTPGDCFAKLCKLSGYYWYIDYSKNIHYFPLSNNASPMSITEDSSWVKDVQISKDNSNLRNRVYVRGGTYLSDTVTISQVADGEQTTFLLPEKPHELTISEDAVSKTVGIKNLDDAADYDYLLSYQEKYIEVGGSVPAPPSVGTVMTYTFKYDIPVLVAVEDTDSIAISGQYEFAIFDTTIKNQDDARARALAELTDYAKTIIDGSFTTYETGFYAGQYVSINLSSLGINENYIIQKVTAKGIGKGVFVYTILIANTKKLGIIGFLKRMLETEKNTVSVDIDEVVDELYNPEKQDILISDDLLSITSSSPPFKWGASSWGFSQWGS